MIAMETTMGSEGSRALPSISLSPGLQRPCSSSPHSEEEDDDMEPSTVPGTPPPKKVGARGGGASLVAPTERLRQPRGRPGFTPWVGKIPWRRAWQPTPGFWPGESPWTKKPGGLQSMRLQSQTPQATKQEAEAGMRGGGWEQPPNSPGFLCSLASSARCSLAPSWPLHTLPRAPALCWLKTVRAKAKPSREGAQ